MGRPGQYNRAETGKGPDRRGSFRYSPTIKKVILGWGWGDSRVELPVDLVSISVQGCMVKSRVCPELGPGEPIWLKAVGMRASDWVEGRIVSTLKPFLRKHEIRIQFVSTLPFQIFKVLVYGRDKEVAESARRPEHEHDQLWR